MKKKFLISLVLLIALFIQAKDHVVVVKQENNMPKGATEVTVEPSGSSDSIIVTPGDGITSIQVTVEDVNGGTVSQNVLPVDNPTPLNVNTPDNGTIIICDNTGIVYMDN